MSNLIDRDEVLKLIKRHDEKIQTASLHKLYNQVYDLPLQQQWIPVSERLPEEGLEVQLKYEVKYTGKYIVNSPILNEFAFKSGNKWSTPTHWQPLPPNN